MKIFVQVILCLTTLLLFSESFAFEALERGEERIQPGEEKVFQSAGEFIKQLQLKRSQEGAHGDERLLRGFHAKGHACLKAEFRVFNELPADFQIGPLFSQARAFPAWVRFSNGNTFVQKDSANDFRGLGIKVLDVPGPKILTGKEEAQTQDFLMLANPRMVAPDGPSFMEFVKASSAGIASLSFVDFLVRHPRTQSFMLENLIRKVKSMRNERFWSGSAFKWGEGEAMHYLVRPCSIDSETNRSQHPNYLREDLIKNLKQGPVCYNFFIQKQLDTVQFPVEDASIEWDEDQSVPFPVAQLIIPQQDLFSQQVRKEEAFCEQLAFNPWHSAPEYRPLGSINRIRKAVYDFSQSNRDALPEPEVDEVILPKGQERFFSGQEVLAITDSITASNFLDFQARFANLHLSIGSKQNHEFADFPIDEFCIWLTQRTTSKTVQPLDDWIETFLASTRIDVISHIGKRPQRRSANFTELSSETQKKVSTKMKNLVRKNPRFARLCMGYGQTLNKLTE